jgi:hypothetical protein
MNTDHTIVDFAKTSQPLPRGTDGMCAALGGSGFVQTASRLFVRVFACDKPLTRVTRACLVPLDRFDEAL